MTGFLTDDVEELMNEMDPNGDGQVSFEEFEAWWKVNMEGGAKDTATTNAAVMQELADLRRQLEAAVARGTTTSGEAETDREVVVATSERLEAAEADAADAKSELAAMTKQLAQVETKLAAAEIKDEGANAMQQEVVELRAKLDAAEKAASVAVEVSGTSYDASFLWIIQLIWKWYSDMPLRCDRPDGHDGEATRMHGESRARRG